ncbi:MAG: hypothetical protein AB7G39_12615 [Alphaproteobacteria bacterium]
MEVARHQKRPVRDGDIGIQVPQTETVEGQGRGRAARFRRVLVDLGIQRVDERTETAETVDGEQIAVPGRGKAQAVDLRFAQAAMLQVVDGVAGEQMRCR